MKTFLYTTILALAVLLPATASAGTDLTFNPGFETGGGYPDNWAEWSANVSTGGDGYTTYHVNDGSARTGQDCVEAYGTQYAFSYQDHSGISVGQDYTLAAYFKDVGGSTGPVQLTLEYRDGPRAEAGNAFYKEVYEPTIPNDGSWHQVTLTYNTPATTELITICVGKGNGSGSYLYDDVYFGIGLPDGAEIDNPDPSDNQSGVSLNPTLSWVVTGSYSSPTFHVYFGEDETDVTNGTGGTYKGGQGGTSYVPSALQGAAYYFWRIDVEDLGETYTGMVWKFSTMIELPACLEVLLGDLNDDCEVNLGDILIMAGQWCNEFCTPPYCADIDPTDGVKLPDFALISKDWQRSVYADVVINEFMASNTTVLQDEDSGYPDWIELKNLSGSTVNLDGWHLTDNDGNPDKWQFPATSIGPGQFLVIFASSKDRNIDPNGQLHTNFSLDIKGDYLGLYRPDGSLAHEYSPEYPFQAEDISFGLGILPDEGIYTNGYFFEPTPGAENGLSVSNLGPNIDNVVHTPSEPSVTDPIIVTASVTPKLKPVGSVSLYYRVMFGSETSTSMFDDGTHNDGAAGDGVYGATIPSGLANPGEMLRYYITASDPNYSSRSPMALDLEGMRQSPQYHGTIINDPSITSNIAVLHWFVENVAAADDRGNRAGTRASVYYNGEFYDNMYCRVRGGSITGPENLITSYKFEFNRGYYFRFSPSEGRVDEFNLNSNYPDKAYMRQDLSFESFRDAGGEYCETFPMSVYRNDQYFGLQTFIEQVDGDYLERNGLDTEGALYKMYNAMNSTSSTRKKTREYEDNSDLQALVDGIALSGTDREKYIFDNLNLPSIVNYAAVNTIINEIDHGKKNYYAYRDTNGSGEWRFLPWDKELTFGKQWSPTELLLDDDLFYYNRWSTPPADDLQNGGDNLLLNAIYTHSRTNQMYHRRLRSLADLLLQAPGTPYAQRYYENRADALYTLMLPDTTLHYNKWANPWAYDEDQSFAQAIVYMKSDYLDERRDHMYGAHSVDYGGTFVHAQVSNPPITIGTIEFNPASGIQDEEYIELTNSDPCDAVDISGWKLTGGVWFTFQPGTVIPAGDSLYVSPNVVAFRARSTSPKGNEANFVQGNYSGHLSSWGETVNLLAADDTVIDTETYAPAPSDQQRYLRITELMYHPANPAPPSPYNDEDFEYIELMNIGPSALDLGGVSFTNGIGFIFPVGISSAIDRVIDITDSWRYEQTDTDLGTSWRPYAYDDNSWSQGDALLYVEGAGLPAPKNTPLTLGPITFYFRTHFNLSADPAIDTITLEMNTVIDDGAVFYLNGTEVYRLGMTGGGYNHSTFANRSVGNASYEGPFTIPAASLLAGDNVMAVEVHQTNTDGGSSDIVFGLTLDADITYGNPPSSVQLAPHEVALLTKNTAAFESRYGSGYNILGQYAGFLSNGGEEVKLEDLTNSTILEFDYKDGWFDITDGGGFSLTIIDVNDTNLDIWDDKDGWRSSNLSGGTPGSIEESTLNPGDIVINELLAHSDVILYDWIELHNTSDKAINIGGWFLSDSNKDDPNRMKYEIAPDTTIDPNNYIVFYENLHFGNPSDPGCNSPFQFSENGETAYLQSGQSGVLTGYYDEEDFGASDKDIAFGRYHKTSTDTFNFVAMTSNTPGSANAYPKVGPIVINEIMYHPPTYPDAEYVELLNISGSPVTLYDSSTLEPWQFLDDAGDPTPGLEFYFPTGPPTTIAAGGYFLLIKDLAAFTSEFGAPASAYAVWPSGSLSNAQEEPLLSMPGDLKNGDRQYIRIDKVNYSDGDHPPGTDPWPTGPDGNGDSLTRNISTQYGNDVANWKSASPSPGAVNP